MIATAAPDFREALLSGGRLIGLDVGTKTIRNVESMGLPILLWDERWSTQAVERQMIAADVSRAKRAEQVDCAAAAYILQGAIDALMMA